MYRKRKRSELRRYLTLLPLRDLWVLEAFGSGRISFNILSSSCPRCSSIARSARSFLARSSDCKKLVQNKLLTNQTITCASLSARGWRNYLELNEVSRSLSLWCICIWCVQSITKVEFKKSNRRYRDKLKEPVPVSLHIPFWYPKSTLQPRDWPGLAVYQQHLELSQCQRDLLRNPRYWQQKNSKTCLFSEWWNTNNINILVWLIVIGKD